MISSVLGLLDIQHVIFRFHLFIGTYYRFIDYRNNNPKQGRFWLAALHRNIGVREFLPKKLRRDQGGKGIVNETRVIRQGESRWAPFFQKSYR